MVAEIQNENVNKEESTLVTALDETTKFNNYIPTQEKKSMLNPKMQFKEFF